MGKRGKGKSKAKTAKKTTGVDDLIPRGLVDEEITPPPPQPTANVQEEDVIESEDEEKGKEDEEKINEEEKGKEDEEEENEEGEKKNEEEGHDASEELGDDDTEEDGEDGEGEKGDGESEKEGSEEDESEEEEEDIEEEGGGEDVEEDGKGKEKDGNAMTVSQSVQTLTGVIAPTFYIKDSEYVKRIKIATRCHIAKAVENIDDMLDTHEKEWFHSHPQFRHFFHMPRDPNHKAMGMWMLLLRMVETQKLNEAWFVVNGVPIRYSMKEHCLISGLHYHAYPSRYKEIGSLAFTEKHFGKGKKVTQELVEKKFVQMRKHTSDRLKMAVLYFLCTVIKGSDKQGADASPVDPFLRRISSDLDACRTFPWGRYTFMDSLKEIDRMMRVFKNGIVNASARFTSFITPLELLAFEAIPCLRNEFRDDFPAEKTCPRMCKSTFKPGSMRGFPIGDINTKLGESKVSCIE